MTIRIYDNRIEFDNYTLSITAKGLEVLRKNTNTYATFTAASYTNLNPYLGENSGYVAGGWLNPGAVTTVDRMPFRDYNISAAIGSLSQARCLTAGHSSSTFGYVSGGYDGGALQTIDKFPFAGLSIPATSVGTLGVARYGSTGHSSNTSAYVAGGFSTTNNIRKFPFAVDTDAVSIPGVLTQARYYGHAHQSLTDGYVSGGIGPPGGGVATMDKFSFATDSNATAVGSLSRSVALTTGISSISSGYVVGGGWPTAPSPSSTLIEKFSFITNQSSTGIGNLLNARHGAAGYSSSTSGYVAGGLQGGTNLNNVERFPFASGPNAFLSWNLSGLTQAREYTTGHQN